MQLNQVPQDQSNKMEKQYSPSQREKKVTKKLPFQKPEISEKPKTDDQNNIEKKIENTEQQESVSKKVEEKKTEKKKQEIIKKELAVVNGKSLRISYKYAGDVCRVIRGKTPSQAIERIDAALKFKRAIPMHHRETAHQKGRGISGGKFPVNVCKAMIDLVKQVEANANYNGVENPVIVIAKADKASMPFRRSGTRGKRAHVYIEVRDKTKLVKKKK